MAFDMFAGDSHVAIEHREEYIFSNILENDQFPLLNWLWENYYNGPRISPEQANRLVHECIQLKSILSNEGSVGSVHFTLDRLMLFFSQAYVSNDTIRCESD